MSQITVTGNLLDPSGTAIVGASVTFELVNTAGNVPLVSGTNVVVPLKISVTTIAAGAFTATTQGNDTITPAGTIYKVTYNGTLVGYYSFTGVGPINLNSTSPLSQIPIPTGPVPTNVLTGNNTFNGLINFSSSAGFGMSNNLALNTAPTISPSSGFNTGTMDATPNGTIAFNVTVGSGTANNTGTISLPAAAHGWNCVVTNITNPATSLPRQAGGTTTTAVINNYNAAGTPTNWTNGDVLQFICFAR